MNTRTTIDLHGIAARRAARWRRRNLVAGAALAAAAIVAVARAGLPDSSGQGPSPAPPDFAPMAAIARGQPASANRPPSKEPAALPVAPAGAPAMKSVGLTSGSTAGSPSRARIPLWVKLLYTGFVCTLVPYYLRTYGPTNFLYYCDIALFMTLVAVWKEDPLWASMPAVGILLPQVLWMADFVGGLCGRRLLGMTAYMFNPGIPLFARALSLFHFWLPLFLIWVVWRLGYDGRAFWAWTAVAWVLMLICYFLMPRPPAPSNNPNLPVNINYVYGPNRSGPQTWMPPLTYLLLLLAGLPLCTFLPTHLLLGWIMPVYRNMGVSP